MKRKKVADFRKLKTEPELINWKNLTLVGVHARRGDVARSGDRRGVSAYYLHTSIKYGKDSYIITLVISILKIISNEF